MYGKRTFSLLTLVTLVTFGIYFLWYHPNTFTQGSFRDQIRDDGVLIVEKPWRADENFRLRNAFLSLRPVFNITGHDVVVFLHIQKTGGTYFGKNLVRNLVLERQCLRTEQTKTTKARFECKRPNSDEIWLYSRYSTGWLCGLHADWTTLASCVPKVLKSHMGIQHLNETRLFYVTLLRNPVDRFLSEFKHVQRGATWKTSTYVCNGTKYKLPVCYEGPNWRSVNLTEFLNCPYNMAVNRQTRMLANLNKVGCYNREAPSFLARGWEKVLLQSAKENLRALSYFGLVEYQKESQYLFEVTFGLKFTKDFSTVSDTWSKEAREEVNPKQLLQIRKVNRLDRQLYSYARALFFKRLKYFDLTSEDKFL